MIIWDSLCGPFVDKGGRWCPKNTGSPRKLQLSSYPLTRPIQATNASTASLRTIASVRPVRAGTWKE